ncbi:MAG: hypothetical protein R2764_24185 [Bacteroidales bacterium]
MVKLRLKDFLKNELVKRKPEYADCIRVSKEFKIPLVEVYSEINKILNAQNE